MWLIICHGKDMSNNPIINTQSLTSGNPVFAELRFWEEADQGTLPYRLINEKNIHSTELQENDRVLNDQQFCKFIPKFKSVVFTVILNNDKKY